ncbi:MAG: Spo0E family sporulation regulatory protein-aspartic acid phosphatase [Firmicutes bacterium]|nr:Spo0E family sporulation regulatory protein-aspartic acid phosphatase [Bacillota bacterium]
MCVIDRERERLHRIAKRWGLRHKKTLRQSKKVDRLLNNLMSPTTTRRR